MALEVKHAADIIREPGTKLILTASRRTDMPAFYHKEIVEGLTSGVFQPKGPYVPVWELRFRPDDVHSVHLWSQDFSTWLALRPSLDRLGYRYFYRFTILPDDPICKPKAPRLADQLRQLRRLAGIEGPDRVDVAVDPIVRYRLNGEARWNVNLDDFARIAEAAAEAGVGRIRTSFFDRYKKLERRQKKIDGFEFLFLDKESRPDLEAMIDRTSTFASAAAERGIALETCCEKGLERACIPNVHAGACIDGKRLNRIIGPGASTRPDSGQRRTLGCRCTGGAMDVGRYDSSHACGHQCPQCYALA